MAIRSHRCNPGVCNYIPFSFAILQRATPQDRGGHTDHDDFYAFLGGLLFIIMLLAVSYLVFLICTVTRRRLSREHSVTPYTPRRQVVVELNKYENCNDLNSI